MIDWDKELYNIQRWNNELLNIHQSRENPYEWLLAKDNVSEWLMDNAPDFLDKLLRHCDNVLKQRKTADKERLERLSRANRFIMALAEKIYKEAEEL